MLQQLKALVSTEAFCKGCETYAEMLVEMGLVPAIPTANGSVLTNQSAAEPPITPIHVTNIAQNAADLGPDTCSSHNLYQLN
jgi:hypothetical protein